MNLQISQMRTLICLSTVTSYTKAASLLGVSSVAVSKQVKAIEKVFGKPVVFRSTRNLALTPFGKALVEQCVVMIEHYDQTMKWASCELEARFSTLTVMMHDPTIYDVTIEPYVAEFKELHPEIDLIIQVAPAAIASSSLEADVYWGMNNYFGRKHPGVIAIPVANVELGIYASTDYIRSHGEPKDIDELDHHLRVGHTNHKPDDCLYYANTSMSDSVTATKKMRSSVVTSRNPIILAARGLGIVNASPSDPQLKDLLAAGSLIPILRNHWIRSLNIYSYYDIANLRQKEVKIFVTFFREKNRHLLQAL